MPWLERVENRLHWLAIPGLFKWLTLLGVIVFAWQWVDPNVVETIAFDRGKILEGEFWRVFTFAFTGVTLFPLTAFGALFLFFAVMIAFLVSDSLEQVWGPTRLSLYIIVGWLGLVVGQFLLGLPSLGGSYLYTSLFLAFCTYFPRYEFRLFFFIPVQVRFLGWLALGMLVLSVFSFPPNLFLVLPTLLPYGIWVLPAFLRDRSNLAAASRRRNKFEGKKTPEAEPFHRCSVCQRTEKSDPHLDFRTYPDGTEYCVHHLPDPKDQP